MVPQMTWEEAVEWLRRQPDRQAFVRDCYYDDPVTDAAARFLGSEEWSAIRDLLRGHLPGDVLEIGAGRGIVSWAFAREGSRVTALEPDPSALVGRGAIAELVGRTGVSMRVEAGAGEALPFRQDSFDVVFTRCVLHHAHNLAAACVEVARVLRPGGVFLAEREHVISRPEDLESFLAAHPLHFLYGGERAYLLEAYKRAIVGAGLRVRRTLGPFDHPINFAPPVSRIALDQMTVEAFAKRIPRRFAELIGNRRAVRWLYARSLTYRSRIPGRFYSFLAVKPRPSRLIAALRR